MSTSIRHFHEDALAAIARAVAAQDPGLATNLAHRIGGVLDDSALVGIATALSGTDPKRARDLAERIQDEGGRGRALAAIAQEIAHANPDEALILLSRAVDLADNTPYEVTRSRVLAAAAAAMASIHPERAQALLDRALDLAGRQEVQYIDGPPRMISAVLRCAPQELDRVADAWLPYQETARLPPGWRSPIPVGLVGLSSVPPSGPSDGRTGCRHMNSHTLARSWPRLIPTGPMSCSGGQWTRPKGIPSRRGMSRPKWRGSTGLARVRSLSGMRGTSCRRPAGLATTRSARSARHWRIAIRPQRWSFAAQATDDVGRSRALAMVATTVIATDPTRGRRLLEQAARLAETADVGFRRDLALRDVAAAILPVDPARAINLAEQVVELRQRMEALANLAMGMLDTNAEHAMAITARIDDWGAPRPGRWRGGPDGLPHETGRGQNSSVRRTQPHVVGLGRHAMVRRRVAGEHLPDGDSAVRGHRSSRRGLDVPILSIPSGPTYRRHPGR